jgi:hypothetical protein
MDEMALRELLASAVAAEPPMGPVATAGLRADRILRRRRLTRATAGSVAALSVAFIVAPALYGGLGRPDPAGPPPGSRPAAWVLSDGGRITPVGTIRGPLRPVAASSFPQAVITPDGKTIYVLTYPRVTPISTATGRRGKPIAAGQTPDDIGITPNGKTVYVLSMRARTATPIKVGFGPFSLAITPNRKTVYVADGGNSVTPINVATNEPGKPINIGFEPFTFAVTPDGKTVYVVTTENVVPIATATNTAGKPITLALGQGGVGAASCLSWAPGRCPQRHWCPLAPSFPSQPPNLSSVATTARSRLAAS